MTTAADAARSFYGELFAWTEREGPREHDSYHRLLLASGGDAGAIYQMTADLKAQRVAPHWTSFVAVEDAAAATARARELGGKIVNEAFDVFGMGRVVILQDPTGAMLSLWEAGDVDGVARDGAARGAPGRLCWHELATSDGEVASRFYRGLFGWEAHVEDHGEMRYTTFVAAAPGGKGLAVAGMLQLSGAWRRIPSHWMPYFSVGDCDVAAATAARLGGAVLMPPTSGGEDGEGARSAVLRDGQHAAFGVRESIVNKS